MKTVAPPYRVPLRQNIYSVRAYTELYLCEIGSIQFCSWYNNTAKHRTQGRGVTRRHWPKIHQNWTPGHSHCSWKDRWNNWKGHFKLWHYTSTPQIYQHKDFGSSDLTEILIIHGNPCYACHRSQFWKNAVLLKPCYDLMRLSDVTKNCKICYFFRFADFTSFSSEVYKCQNCI